MAETDGLEQLRKELHEQVDRVIDGVEEGLPVEWAALGMIGRLLKASEGWIDEQVGRNLSAEAIKDPNDARRRGREVRELAKAARYSVDEQTPETTATHGMIGATVLVEQLAVYCNEDPYLHHLAEALAQHRYGQQHPWLKPRKAVTRPASSPQSVLELRAIPFGVIEYLTASGTFDRKTDAKAAVIERLEIEEDTFNDWRKQQNKERRSDFNSMLWAGQSAGDNVRGFRERLARIPDAQMQAFVNWNDHQFGLAAVERCAGALKALASK
jgi:hypothetical protein